ncbi:hypothetical protein SLEP1_g49105 [Rubroshorea leprosula]|uniref:Cysteine-rich transmembrane domain-containing protein n=1 Tax=Rubroshorea leprosula TaxID=152421 RepID=A0AAV5LXY9_9ROSI|nr:hypothetical protein SLEP1_g49105 [Rubroshorea leprosula]
MTKSEAQGNQPPAGYPTDNPSTGKKRWFVRRKNKGERGFIEGCLFALCCCWLCEGCLF